MIAGQVTSNREAIIPLTVIGPAGRRDIEAIVDTGFNDYLTLSPELIAILNLRAEIPALVGLGDGGVVVMDCFRGTVMWDGRARPVLVLAGAGGALVGMALLAGTRLTVDIVEGGTVSIAPL